MTKSLTIAAGAVLLWLLVGWFVNARVAAPIVVLGLAWAWQVRPKKT